MGLYFRNLSIPEGHAFTIVHNPDGYYAILGDDISDFNGHINKVKAEEIEEPHDDLIGVNASLRYIFEKEVPTLNPYKKYDYVDITVLACKAIDNAPIIIKGNY